MTSSSQGSRTGAPGRPVVGLGVLMLFVAVVSGGCEGSGAVAFVPPLGSSSGPSAVESKGGRAGCIPNCRGKSCGTDGCGGHCGRCSKGRICLADRCIKNNPRDLCRLVIGRWKGVLQARPLHFLDGRIFSKGKACRGTFRITYNLPRRGSAWVVQQFVITFTGTTMLMRGVRLSANSSNSSYNLDRFAGHLNRKLTRFSGQNRDVRGSTSSFYIDKK